MQLVDLGEVRKLCQLLSAERAHKFPTRIEVGNCLHNINPTLLDCWTEFSRKSDTFKEGECEEIWPIIKTKYNSLNIGSLHHWVKIDNPREYENFSTNKIKNHRLKGEYPQDIAELVFNTYKYHYKCTSIKHNIWYEFQNHRWSMVDYHVSLEHEIRTTISNKLVEIIGNYNDTICNQQDEIKNQYIQKSKNLANITYKLKTHSFLHKIMKECQIIFYDPQFESLLDSNRNLIGFENGIYDLQNAEFRDGRPEDYISLSTENDYIEFKEDDELILAIYSFLSQVFYDPEVRDYVLILLASFLEGYNPS
jgi:hypothetical protein